MQSKPPTVLAIAQFLRSEVEQEGGNPTVLEKWIKKVESSGFANKQLNSLAEVLMLLNAPNSLIDQVGVPVGWAGSVASFKSVFVAAWKVITSY